MRTGILARTDTLATTGKRAAAEPLTLVRWSIALCYIWFGALKFFPGLSPAEALAGRTINALSLGLIHGQVAMVLLACLECAIGFALLTRSGSRAGLHVLLAHMLFTFSGSDPTNLLKANLSGYSGPVPQHYVGLRVEAHQNFIKNVFEAVGK